MKGQSVCTSSDFSRNLVVLRGIGLVAINHYGGFSKPSADEFEQFEKSCGQREEKASARSEDNLAF